MHKVVFGVVLMAALMMYVRHQFNSVIRQATGKPQPGFRTAPQESRRKCIMCGGSGRSVQFNFATPNRSAVSQPCPTCHGTGWVDNPRTW